jgi:hypothetical protein
MASLGFETQLKLRELLLAYSEGEMQVEKQRQSLAAIREFEPY